MAASDRHTEAGGEVLRCVSKKPSVSRFHNTEVVVWKKKMKIHSSSSTMGNISKSAGTFTGTFHILIFFWLVFVCILNIKSSFGTESGQTLLESD